MTGARRAILSAAALVLSATMGGAETTYQILRFQDLDGWPRDNHAAALAVFQNTCADMDAPEWNTLCALGQTNLGARAFFELFFRPVLINGDDTALFTGYFEPELNGSRSRHGPYQYPIYRKPPDINGSTWYSRTEIEEQGLLAGRGLEIAWVEDPVDVFFLQIQGSGRISLDDGGAIRVGFGGANGHNYRSIGQELIRRGVYPAHQVSAQVIRNWVRRNPVEGRLLLQHNPSYVFFREVSEVPSEKGPLGAMNRSITTGRTVAIDPAFTPLGAPVWIEKRGTAPMYRLMIAQDTGSAIKGAQRADIFYGTGERAGRAAGRIKDPGRLVVLMPIAVAHQLAPEG